MGKCCSKTNTLSIIKNDASTGTSNEHFFQHTEEIKLVSITDSFQITGRKLLDGMQNNESINSEDYCYNVMGSQTKVKKVIAWQ